MTSHLPAVLLDVDNLALGGGRRAADLEATFARVALVTSGMPVTAAANRRVAETHLPCLARRGWRILLADLAPDAADLLLLEAGRDHIAHGRGTLLIGSGDHIFAGLADGAELHVMSFRDQLSRRLRLASTSVTLLDDLVPARRTAA